MSGQLDMRFNQMGGTVRSNGFRGLVFLQSAFDNRRNSANWAPKINFLSLTVIHGRRDDLCCAQVPETQTLQRQAAMHGKAD